ncbi:ATP-binding protein [Telluria aromaticivorans]|uniref:OmpR/PhoB-type domain-containing protein n=1 Tax=Telluria aromaticivorans TaxID=2725995 RepID=A0A7Y2JYB6_9BURK|nr:winged helix-turn-helix domain-containing protein [Telluria aromaticivorans]NNG21994.1 hypothetical protein [Telluria aromaticivorans]
MGMRDAAAGPFQQPEAEPACILIQFGPFELWPELRELRRDGARVPLSGRAFKLLALLVERAGQVVGRGELVSHLWPDGDVEESSLRAHVAGLRKALGENRYILNVLGRGYTFVGHCRRHVDAGQAPRAAARAAPAPLPVGTGPVLGRDDAIALLCGQVRRRRMVSIVGAGGMGKSTVARVVAAAVAGEFDGNVCLVDLAQAATGTEAVAALAAGLRIAEAGGNAPREPESAVFASLANARLLVVMDNCGHLADAVAVFAERLLAEACAVHLLVTSRESLCLQEEWVYRLAPLGTADAPGAPPGGRQAPAETLFVQRASAAGLRLDRGDNVRIARLCRQLDGNPLAIELAAARAGVLGLDGVENGLDCLFAPAGPADAGDPRHRTFETMLDWSVELLAPHERTVLQRLAVFRAGFTLEDAAEVCACTQVGPALVVEGILALSAKSLVNVEPESVPPHYRLANTTRMYAQRRLMRTPEAPALRRSHARNLHALCVRANADIVRLPVGEWRLRYAATVEDLEAVLDWAFSPCGDAALGVELVAAACFVMVEAGRGDEHRHQVLRALRALERLAPCDAALELRLLTALTLLDSHFAGDESQENAAWARARLLELVDRIGPGEDAVIGVQAIAGWGLGQGRYPLVLQMAERIGECAARTAEPAAAVLASRVHAQALHFLGRHEAALALAQATLDNAPPRRNVPYLTKVPLPVSMGVLKARILWIRSLSDQAVRAADEALAQAEGQHPHALCMALGMAAIPVAVWRGDVGRTAMLIERFIATSERWGAAFWTPWRDSFRRMLEPGPAWPEHAAPTSNHVLCDMLATFDPALAVPDCLRRVREGEVAWNAPEVLRAAGLRLLRGGAQAEAGELFLEARALARHQGALGWELRLALSLAELWAGTGRDEEARQALARLLARFEEGAETADLARARALLASAPKRTEPVALWCASLLDTG